ncbi:MAG: hypothetical protein U0V03_08300 [Bacteroidia bacterium]
MEINKTKNTDAVNEITTFLLFKIIGSLYVISSTIGAKIQAKLKIKYLGVFIKFASVVFISKL